MLAVTVAVVLGASPAPLEAQSNRSEDRKTVRQSAALAYKRAEGLIRRQKLEQARATIEKALEKHPDSGVFASGVLTEPYYPHYLLGVIHIELEDYDKAILEFEEEERQGQIQLDTALYETLTLQLAKAKQTDNQSPVIKLTGVEPVETRFDGEREIAEVRFSGVVVDDGGLASLTIHATEINFKQTDDGFRFDETLRLAPLVSDVRVVAVDVAGNRGEQAVAIDLPPLDLGPAAAGVHAILVGVDRYERHEGSRAGDCPQQANTCGDPSSFVCYNLANLSAAANDAQRFHDFLIRRGVPSGNIQLLLSREGQVDATRDNVLAALDNLRDRRGDKIIFFFAGHGVNSRRHKNLMLLSDTRGWECEDTPPEDATDLEASALGVDTVERALMRASFAERYVILDACRSPRLANTRAAGVASSPAGFSSRGVRVVPDAIARDVGGREPVLFYATFDKSVSVEWNKKQAGYFTWYLLQGLRRDLSLWELKSYVQDHVQQRTTEDHGVTQKPHVVLPEELENDYELQKKVSLLGRIDDP